MAELQRRRMGRTEMQPKALGLGAAWLHQGPEHETIAAIHRAIELGINYIDTYPGHEEPRWGRALQGGLREKIYLQAKVGTHPERRKNFSAAGTRWSVEGSLRDLKTDYLDAVLIHDPIDIEDPLAPGRSLDELLKMKEEGLVRHIGLGVRSHAFHQRAIETGHIDIVLTFLDYTLLDQSAVQTTLPLARKHDVGIILASPLGMGSLTGVEPDPQVERRRNPGKEPKAHAMWQWCRERGVNIRHLALQFCLAAPIDGVVMFGPANQQQVEEGYEAATAEIPPEVWRDFKAEFGVGI
ncbi:aldo/keto reductase [Candidatus Poribacteria bacterium]|nr:aldo/keto reductase [Candidatus Poribacteria bacterium]